MLILGMEKEYYTLKIIRKYRSHLLLCIALSLKLLARLKDEMRILWEQERKRENALGM